MADSTTRTSPGWTGATGTPTRLLLLRHGQTELSIQRRYSGRGNPALTDLGERQARAAARRLAQIPIDQVVSSPLQRAVATASELQRLTGLPEHQVQVRESLIETDFGSWEGLTFSEAAAADPDQHRAWLGSTAVAPGGGESFDEVTTRVLADLADLRRTYPGQTVLVVSHVTPIKVLLRAALDVGPQLLYRLHLDLASLSIADWYSDDRASVRLVNDTSYHD